MGSGRLLAGIRRWHRYEDCPNAIPQQWSEFRSLGKFPGQCGTVSYGAVCAHSADSLEYLCAVEVADFKAIDPALGRMRLQPQHYAVFIHEGPISGIRATWDGILHDWLPRSGRVAANAPNFERYDERYDPRTGLGGLEIWCALQPAVSQDPISDGV